jgi:hypothetical protein
MQQLLKIILCYAIVVTSLVISGCQAPTSTTSPVDTVHIIDSKPIAGPVIRLENPVTSVAEPIKPERNISEYLNPIERQVISLHNELRADPANYAERYLKPLLGKFKGKLLFDTDLPPGVDALTTVEGISAVQEAIAVLQKQKPLTPMIPAHALTLSARDHAKDQSAGRVGHESSDGASLLDRFKRHGKGMRHVAENISYGPYTAVRILNSLLIDDGVADRGHRKALFSPKYHQIGVAISQHRKFGTVTVIHYADKISSKN